MALIAARVAVIHMGADKTLLVAQQDHDLEEDEMFKMTYTDIHTLTLIHTIQNQCVNLHVAMTCCGGSHPLHRCFQDLRAQYWAR